MIEDEFTDAWNSDNFATEPEDQTDDESTDGFVEEAEGETTEETAAETTEETVGEASEETTEEPTDEIDYKTAFYQAQQELKTTVGRLKAAEARAQTPKEEEPRPASGVNDEDNFLATFREQYNDDVLRAVDIMARRAATDLIQNQVYPQIERIAPLARTTEELMAQAHFGAIEAAHPDVYEIDSAPEFNAWIASRPDHIRGAYEFVREQGTPAEVISMLNEYKAVMKPKPAPAPVAPSAAAAVPRRRGTTPVAPSPAKDDFEAAWMEAPDS